MLDSFHVPISGFLGFVGFDASDVVRDALLQFVDEGIRLSPDLASRSGWSTAGALDHLVGEQRSEKFTEE